MDFSSWANSVNNQAVDVQPGLGAQCFGLMQSYINDVLGVPGMIPGNYAIDVYNNPGPVAGAVTKLGPDATPQTGDIAFWQSGSRVAPDSHVAVVNADAGNDLNVYSQNSPQKYTVLQNLPKEGLAGYLRPNQFNNGGPTASGPDATTVDVGSGGTNNALDVINKWILGLLTGKDANGVPGAGHIQNFMTNLFLPSTYIRILSGIAGVTLIIMGIIFIIMDYRASKD